MPTISNPTSYTGLKPGDVIIDIVDVYGHPRPAPLNPYPWTIVQALIAVSGAMAWWASSSRCPNGFYIYHTRQNLTATFYVAQAASAPPSSPPAPPAPPAQTVPVFAQLFRRTIASSVAASSAAYVQAAQSLYPTPAAPATVTKKAHELMVGDIVLSCVTNDGIESNPNAPYPWTLMSCSDVTGRALLFRVSPNASGFDLYETTVDRVIGFIVRCSASAAPTRDPRFPKQCTRCGRNAYIGAFEVEHEDEVAAAACPARRK